MGSNQRAAIVMTDDEIADFLDQSRVATMATNGPGGVPHLVAMWYGVVDGKIYFETKAKSQKAVNLRRDPSIAAMIEAGDTYDQLRGVSIEGSGALLEYPGPIEDHEDAEYWQAGISVFERYQGAYGPDTAPFVELMMNKRVVVRIDPSRVRSWDHRKLGMGAMPVAGTTAAHLGELRSQPPT